MKDLKLDQVLDHDYDGIREYDNPLPAWWLWTFLGTIIFAFIYYIHYEISGVAETQVAEMQRHLDQLPKHAAQGSLASDEQLAALVTDDVLKLGQAQFTSKCAACHGPKGEGLIGPNLTDHFWIHGQGTRADILAVVASGVPDKGMPAWDSMMSGDEVKAVSLYIYTLKGTNPPNPKAPQGSEFH